MVAAVTVSLMQSGRISAQSRQYTPGASFEAASYTGLMIGNKEVARGTNATGGEQLIAKLGTAGGIGLRAGMHNDWLGLEADLFSAGRSVKVKNEFGAGFPNHGAKPLFCSAGGLVYPFGRRLRNGRLRPYLVGGLGTVLFTADLDNINDQEWHNRLTWNIGTGFKWFPADERIYLDFRFVNHRLVSTRKIDSMDLRSATLAVGYRF